MGIHEAGNHHAAGHIEHFGAFELGGQRAPLPHLADEALFNKHEARRQDTVAGVHRQHGAAREG
jgi:hypothetical protein